MGWQKAYQPTNSTSKEEHILKKLKSNKQVTDAGKGQVFISERYRQWT